MAPTDRSIPPPVITNVMPTDTTPMTAASRRIVSALSTLANCWPAVAIPTRQRMKSATTRPEVAADGRAHQPTERSARPARAAPGQRLLDDVVLRRDRVAGGGRAGRGRRLLVRVHAALPSMTRSRTRCSSISSAGPSCTTSPSLMTSTRSARPEDLLHLAGDHDDRDPAFGQRPDQRVDLAAGADVDAAGRLVEQQHPAVAHQPPGQHDLLLVAAGQRAHRTGDAGAGVRREPSSARGRRTRSADPSRKPGPREASEAGDRDVR